MEIRKRSLIILKDQRKKNERLETEGEQQKALGFQSVIKRHIKYGYRCHAVGNGDREVQGRK